MAPSAEPEPAEPTEPTEFAWVAPGSRGWPMPLFAAVWLFFLVNPLVAGWHERATFEGIVGMATTVVFAAVYMLVWLRTRTMRHRLVSQPPARFVVPYLGSLAAMAAVMVATLGEPGSASLVYLAVACVMCLPMRPGFSAVGCIAVGIALTGLVPGWGSQVGTAFAVCAASAAVYGIRSVMNRNIALFRAQQENTRLALADERNRFARDLHDILGHSLTVITVKAELAQRLVDVDPVRTRAELADLERLSRDALADVRRAVEGYRELTLPGELARARAALEAAGIRPVLPGSTDDVPSDLRELFAWTVREGITNVIRHSGARTCEIVLTARSAVVRDDGSGPGSAPEGSGLTGLRERAATLGAEVTTHKPAAGFVLEVSVP